MFVRVVRRREVVDMGLVVDGMGGRETVVFGLSRGRGRGCSVPLVSPPAAVDHLH